MYRIPVHPIVVVLSVAPLCAILHLLAEAAGVPKAQRLFQLFLRLDFLDLITLFRNVLRYARPCRYIVFSGKAPRHCWLSEEVPRISKACQALC